jgi:uncharacterized membrane protein YhaH (DUF805 family)
MGIGYYFKTTGRIGRQTWWLGQLASTLALFALVALLRVLGLMSLGPASGGGVAPGSTSDAISGLIIGVGGAAYLWFNICINGKRWHDRDKSAWWMLIGAIPIIGIWALIENGFLRGTEGPNRFGPDPLVRR